jgi:hypothetical protein
MGNVREVLRVTLPSDVARWVKKLRAASAAASVQLSRMRFGLLARGARSVSIVRSRVSGAARRVRKEFSRSAIWNDTSETKDRRKGGSRYFPLRDSSRFRRSTRRILPLTVFGSSSRNSISRGYL